MGIILSIYYQERTFLFFANSVQSGNVQPNFAYGILRSCMLPLDSVLLAVQGLVLGAFLAIQFWVLRWEPLCQLQIDSSRDLSIDFFRARATKLWVYPWGLKM